MSDTLFGKIDQIGYLVEDLDASVRRWIERTGVGPWTVFRNVSLVGTYRGEPTTVAIDCALGYQGDVQIELIQTTNEAHSPYLDAAGARILGAHHVAWVVESRDAAVAEAEKRGLTVAFEAENPATRVAYMEDRAEPGVLFEIIEGASMRAMIDDGIAASRDWDGSNPVTVIDLAA